MGTFARNGLRVSQSWEWVMTKMHIEKITNVVSHAIAKQVQTSLAKRRGQTAGVWGAL